MARHLLSLLIMSTFFRGLLDDSCDGVFNAAADLGLRSRFSMSPEVTKVAAITADAEG